MGYRVLPGYCLKFSPGLVLLTCLRTNMKTEGKTINTSQSNHEVRNISTSIKCSRLNRAISMVLGGVFNYPPFESSKPVLDNPWAVYGGFAIILYLFRYLSLLALPQALASFFGLLLFNAFPETPKLKVFLFKLNWLKYLIFFKLEIITTSTNDLFPCCNQRRLS